METTSFRIVYAVTAAILFSYFYFQISGVNAFRFLFSRYSKDGEHQPAVQIKYHVYRKVIGFVVLGCIPCILSCLLTGISPQKQGFAMGGTMELWYILLPLSVIIIAINSRTARNPEINSMYPELRIAQWTMALLVLSNVTWAVYLIGYEYLFRGLLLMTLYDVIGAWPAITITTALYSSLHLPKGRKEAIAALPFGLLLAWLTIQTGSVFPAIALHLIQVVAVESYSIYYNSGMSVRLRQ